MASKFKRELTVGSLLLATLVLTTFNHCVERTRTYTTREITSIQSIDDRVVGGSSKSYSKIENGRFRFEYHVHAENHPATFASVVLNPDDETLIDLSWVDHFDFKIRSSDPEGQSLFIYLRNFEPTVSEKDDNESRKYNEALLTASGQMETVTINRDEFYVPTWWKQRYNVVEEAVDPAFDQIEWFEFSTHGIVGSGHFDIESITCRGHWMETAQLNRILLWLWLSGTLAGILYRMSNLKRKLNEKTASAMQLLEHNDLLMSKSATYRELAQRDSLTGLLNRYGVEGRFDELSHDSDFRYSVILFDLDEFKQINDNFGHCYGDRVLFDVARIVKAKVGLENISARWGGDEFLLVMIGKNAQQAAQTAESIRLEVLASNLEYTCSFGVSQLRPGDTLEQTLQRADVALYDSKDFGRNAICVEGIDGNQHCIKQPDEMGAEAGNSQPTGLPLITLMPNEAIQGEFTIFE
jgi:diguanylate cyclase (GGDEF)-like protein